MPPLSLCWLHIVKPAWSQPAVCAVPRLPSAPRVVHRPPPLVGIAAGRPPTRPPFIFTMFACILSPALQASRGGATGGGPDRFDGRRSGRCGWVCRLPAGTSGVAAGCLVVSSMCSCPFITSQLQLRLQLSLLRCRPCFPPAGRHSPAATCCSTSNLCQFHSCLQCYDELLAHPCILYWSHVNLMLHSLDPPACSATTSSWPAPWRTCSHPASGAAPTAAWAEPQGVA